MQLEVTDPSFNLASFSELDADGEPIYGSVPFQIVVGNVGDATVKGFDIEFKALLSDNVEVGFNMTSINDAFVNAPAAYPGITGSRWIHPIWTGPQIGLATLCRSVVRRVRRFQRIQCTRRNGNLRLQHNYVGDSLNQLNDGFTSPRLSQGDYAVTDAILGIEMENWRAQIFVNNLSDERGITYEDSQDFDQVWGKK